MERRQHDRLLRPGRRQNDRRIPAADTRRVLLLGPDEAWRLLTGYEFRESGYTVYAAADLLQAVALTARLLPDVVVVQQATPDTLGILARLSEGSSTNDIPVVVLTSSLYSPEARLAQEAGGVSLSADAVDVLVGEVDTLITVKARAQRALKRRLLDIRELARLFAPGDEGRDRLRHLINHLQVAILAVDAQGHCIAASDGTTRLTGYSRPQLLNTSVLADGFAGARISMERWRDFLAHRQCAGTITLTKGDGEDVTVHAAAVAEVMPGFHVAALAAA
jgi:PAS domain S-box-containing protein